MRKKLLSLSIAIIASLSAMAKTIFVSLDGTGTDGTSPESAYPTIAQGYAAAENGDILSLSADTFTLTSELLIDKAVTIRGAGIDQTIIRKPGETNASLPSPTPSQGLNTAPSPAVNSQPNAAAWKTTSAVPAS